MDLPLSLKLNIIKLITKLADYEASFTIGMLIDAISQNGYWPQDLDRVGAYHDVKRIIDSLLPSIEYEEVPDDWVSVYVPKKKLKEIEQEIEQEEKEQNMTVDDIIKETLKNIEVDNNYEFKFPKFNQFWNHGWEKFIF